MKNERGDRIYGFGPSTFKISFSYIGDPLTTHVHDFSYSASCTNASSELLLGKSGILAVVGRSCI